MTLCIPQLLTDVNLALRISTDLFIHSFRVHFLILKNKQGVSLLNLSAVELLALKKYYKNKGLSNTSADFLTNLALFTEGATVELLGSELKNITGYGTRQSYIYLAQAKISGLVKRLKTKNTKVYSIQIHIPDFLLPCNNGLSQLILDKLQNAYGLDLVFTRDCINRITSRSTLIEPSVINDAINSLVGIEKLYLQKDMNILFPKLQHDLQQKSHYLVIDDITKDFSDLNNQQCSFIGYLKQVSRVLSNSNSNSNSNSCLSQLLTCHFLNKEKQLQEIFA